MARNPAPPALAARAAPMTSVLSARRTVSVVGSRIWVPPQSAQRARRGVTRSVAVPRPRTVRVRPCPNGRSRPGQRGQPMLPACRIRSARSGHGTTITEGDSVHVGERVLSHRWLGRGRLVLRARLPGRGRHGRADEPAGRAEPTSRGAGPPAVVGLAGRLRGDGAEEERPGSGTSAASMTNGHRIVVIQSAAQHVPRNCGRPPIPSASNARGRVIAVGKPDRSQLPLRRGLQARFWLGSAEDQRLRHSGLYRRAVLPTTCSRTWSPRLGRGHEARRA